MKKILIFGLAFLGFATVFACQGKYVVTIQKGSGAVQKCADDCGDAKSIAAEALMNGAKQVRIDARGGLTVNSSCDGKTYTSANQIK